MVPNGKLVGDQQVLPSQDKAGARHLLKKKACLPFLSGSRHAIKPEYAEEVVEWLSKLSSSQMQSSIFSPAALSAP